MRILFAQKSDANSWGSEKRHKRRQDQGTKFCSGAIMGAPLTALEAPENPALDDVGCFGVLHRYNLQLAGSKALKSSS
jgi:hypothetical protein